MWIAFTFSILSAISSFTEGYFIKKAIRSDNDKNIRTEVLTEIATEKVFSTYDEIYRRHSVGNGIVGKGRGDYNLDDTSKNLRQAMTENEFKYRAIRQAIFTNIYNMGADVTI